jgi:hypothetical protein
MVKDKCSGPGQALGAGVTIQDTFCDAINIGYDPFSRYGLLPKIPFLCVLCASV